MTIAKCPFCGEECYHSASTGTCLVRCTNCPYCTGSYPTESEAISAHNLVSRSAEQVKIAVEALEVFEDFPTNGWWGGPLTSAVGIYEDGSDKQHIAGFKNVIRHEDIAKIKAALARIKGLNDTDHEL